MIVNQCFGDITSIVCRKYIGVRLSASRRIWNRLPKHFQRSFLGQAYGHHLHALVRRYGERNQSHATWFLRNRPELELMRHMVKEIAFGSRLNICVLACSRGAEVYSILWAIRPLRPDLKITTYADRHFTGNYRFCQRRHLFAEECKAGNRGFRTFGGRRKAGLQYVQRSEFSR